MKHKPLKKLLLTISYCGWTYRNDSYEIIYVEKENNKSTPNVS